MKTNSKIIYTLGLFIFILKIGIELMYLGGDILWPSIGMMWCITAGINELKDEQV